MTLWLAGGSAGIFLVLFPLLGMFFSALTSSTGGGDDDGDDDVFLFSVCDWAVVRSGWVHLHDAACLACVRGLRDVV